MSKSAKKSVKKSNTSIREALRAAKMVSDVPTIAERAARARRNVLMIEAACRAVANDEPGSDPMEIADAAADLCQQVAVELFWFEELDKAVALLPVPDADQLRDMKDASAGGAR